MPAIAAKLSIADTFTRLLRLTLAGGTELTLGRLMDASEERLDAAAHSGRSHDQLVATRLRDNPRDYRRWELDHSRLMERVLKSPRPPVQATALLSLSFSLSHRKALFEYLRDSSLRGRKRRQVVAHFHGGYSYSQSVVEEHGIYLRSVASLMCTEHLGTTLLVHPAFGDPLHGYQQAYLEYFRTYCHSAAAPPDNPEANTEQALLPVLKFDLLELRTKLLTMAVPPTVRPPRARVSGSAKPKVPEGPAANR